MDLSALLELMKNTEPGSVVMAKMHKTDDGTDVNYEVESINGQKIEEA
jgi:hypothetical protein